MLNNVTLIDINNDALTIKKIGEKRAKLSNIARFSNKANELMATLYQPEVKNSAEPEEAPVENSFAAVPPVATKEEVNTVTKEVAAENVQTNQAAPTTPLDTNVNNIVQFPLDDVIKARIKNANVLPFYEKDVLYRSSANATRRLKVNKTVTKNVSHSQDVVSELYVLKNEELPKEEVSKPFVPLESVPTASLADLTNSSDLNNFANQDIQTPQTFNFNQKVDLETNDITNDAKEDLVQTSQLKDERLNNYLNGADHSPDNSPVIDFEKYYAEVKSIAADSDKLNSDIAAAKEREEQLETSYNDAIVKLEAYRKTLIEERLSRTMQLGELAASIKRKEGLIQMANSLTSGSLEDSDAKTL